MKKCETTAWHVYNFNTLRIKQTILIFGNIHCILCLFCPFKHPFGNNLKCLFSLLKSLILRFVNVFFLCYVGCQSWNPIWWLPSRDHLSKPPTSALIQAPLWHLWRLCRSRFPFSFLLCPVDFLSHGSLWLT